MTRFTAILATWALLAGIALASGQGMQGKMFQTVPVEKAEILQKGEDKMYCPNCGMYHPKFFKTNHAVKLKDGSARQYCSIHCLVEEFELAAMRGKKDQIKETLVVDVNSLKFVDATKAHYVVGSEIAGTMTMNSKYAFAKKTDAEKFAKMHGGKVLSYAAAYDTALNDFAADMAYLYNKRSSKPWKMGEKLYGMCDKTKIDSIEAHSMGEMKAAVKNSGACGKALDAPGMMQADMKLQALTLYIWDVKMKKFEENYGQNEEIQKRIKAMQK